MDTSPPNAGPAQTPRALLNQIQERFPVFREHQPLAIGIDKQIIAQLPDVNKKLLRIALSLHTNSLRYLKTLEKANSRFNLDGTPASELDETHRKHASEILRERFKQAKAQKKAKEEAEKAERQRAEKLRLLTEKFSPRR